MLLCALLLLLLCCCLMHFAAPTCSTHIRQFGDVVAHSVTLLLLLLDYILLIIAYVLLFVALPFFLCLCVCVWESCVVFAIFDHMRLRCEFFFAFFHSPQTNPYHPSMYVSCADGSFQSEWVNIVFVGGSRRTLNINYVVTYFSCYLINLNRFSMCRKLFCFVLFVLFYRLQMGFVPFKFCLVKWVILVSVKVSVRSIRVLK